MKKSRRLSETCRRMYLEGRMDEDFVMKAVTETLGGECVRASREDDMFKHIDFYWQSPKKGVIAIDVKGIKKNKRSDDNKDDSIHWIEMKNVRGNDGWVYGKSDYIAFLTKKQILFVKLDTLRKFAEEKVKDKELVFENPKEFYIPYQRKKYGRLDMTFKCPISDLIELSEFSIDY